jgi:pimeloyl-ACP methyl ester carboxylesterase
MHIPTQQFFHAPNADGTPGAHRLGYLECGEEGAPPLVCVHGLTRNAHDFDALAEALAGDFHVFSLDMAGRGASDWLDNKLAYNYATYLADCLAFVAFRTLERVHWIGTSMGGIIGMMLAAARPGLLASLTLNDIGAVVAREGLERIAAYAGAPHVFHSFRTAEQFLRDITRPFAIRDPEQWKRFAAQSIWRINEKEYILAFDPEIISPFRQETDNFLHLMDIDLNPLWDAVDCPVLLLRGEHSDILRKETASAMARTKGREVTFIEFPDVGHAPALMEEDQISKLERWLLWHRK